MGGKEPSGQMCGQRSGEVNTADIDFIDKTRSCFLYAFAHKNSLSVNHLKVSNKENMTLYSFNEQNLGFSLKGKVVEKGEDS